MSRHPIEEISGYRGKMGIVGPTGHQVAEVDALGYLAVIDIEHHKIHDGEYFMGCDENESLLATANYWLMINPTPQALHGIWKMNCTVAGRFYVYEDAIVGTFSKGTQHQLHNLNRVVDGTSSVLFYSTPTGLNGTGNKIYCMRIGAGAKEGGEVSSREEIMYRPNGTYLACFLPDAVGGKMMINFGFYEQGECC